MSIRLVNRWFAAEKVTTFGPSGFGFVNFGLTKEITLQAPIETFDQGARGFNVYAGTFEKAEFDRIVTHGDGAVGEDTFCTASSFRSGGAWRFQSDPKGGEVEV